MNRLKSIIKDIKWNQVYRILEYMIDGYVVVTGVLNLLNLAGVIDFQKWMLHPAFFGASLLLLLLLQNVMVAKNREDAKLSVMRPYVTGICMAGIVSVCDVPLTLVMFLIVGYFFMTGFGVKYSPKMCALIALIFCVGIEVYSVAMLLNKESILPGSGFMSSVWPDVLFVLAAIVYCVINKDEETAEEAVGEENAQKADGNMVDIETLEEDEAKEEEKPGRLKALMVAWKEKRSAVNVWINTNAKLIARYVGGGLCILSMGLFLFFLAGTFAGANIVTSSEEEVYLLQNCEDTSLVLTMVEGEEEDTFAVVFEKYTGANNQKVQIYDRGDDLYQLVFVENEYAMEVKLDEEAGVYVLGVSPMSDSFEQCWVKQAFIPEQQMYKFLCAYYVPLSYPIMEQTDEIPQLAVQADTGGYEFFTMERTVTDEFVTKTVCKYGEEFAPTLLIENLIGRLGIWSLIVFIAIVLLFCVVIYARRLVGDKPAVLYALVLAFLLMYASVWAVVLFLFIFGVLCINGYLRRYAKQKPDAVKQYNEQLADIVKSEMQEAVAKMEKTLQEMKENLEVE